MLALFQKRLLRRGDEAFTLIELLVVVIIIAVLAAIALPIFLDQSKAAIDASVKSDVRNTVTNVNEFRAVNDTLLPASAEEFFAKGGVLATSKGAYVNVAFTADANYTVCGYNPGGKKYTSYQDAWAFNSATGKFFDYTGLECINAVHSEDNPQYDPQQPTDPTKNPTKVTVRDPNGKYSDDPSDNPSDPTDGPSGGTGPTNPPAGGGHNVTAVCNVVDDSALQLAQGDAVPNLPEAYLSGQGTKAETQIALTAAQKTVFNRQATEMRAAMNWYKTFAAAHPSATPDDQWASAVHNANNGGKFYFSNSNYNGDYDQPENNSDATLKIHVYVWASGDTFNFYIGAGVTDFESQWDYDVSTADIDLGNASIHSDKSILNTDGNQTTGYYRSVSSSGNGNYKQYSPACGQTQKFGYTPVTGDPSGDCTSDDTCTDPGPGDNPGGGGSNSSDPLTVTTSDWQYAFDGPTAADEVAKKGDYPGMCYFDPTDPEQSAKFPLGNELCVDNTGDGTDNPYYGTQLIRTAELRGSDFPSDDVLHVDGDLDFINGDYQCSANDSVHYIDKGNIFTQQFLPYGSHQEAPRVGNSEELDVSDYWTVSEYVQCDTTAQIARVALLITYPENVARTWYGNTSFNSVGGAYFLYQNKQYEITMPGENRNPGVSQTHWDKNDIFNRDSRAPYFYPDGWHGQTIYPQ